MSQPVLCVPVSLCPSPGLRLHMGLAHGGTSKHGDGRLSSVSLSHCHMWGGGGERGGREGERERKRERGRERGREGERGGEREEERERDWKWGTDLAKLKIPEQLESDVQAW